MTQPSLFSKVAPTIARARRKGHAGAERAGQAAGEAWMAWAAGYVLFYARKACRPWLIEEVRDFVAMSGYAADPPPDPRAWGAVIQRLKREGRIKAVGYAPARSSHGSAKVLWEVVR